jgi:hypothetical protein
MGAIADRLVKPLQIQHLATGTKAVRPEERQKIALRRFLMWLVRKREKEQIATAPSVAPRRHYMVARQSAGQI